MNAAGAGRRKSSWEAVPWPPLLLWLFMVTLAITGGWHVRRMRIQDRTVQVQAELATAADLRMKEVTRWFEEREADAKLFSANIQGLRGPIPLDWMENWRQFNRLEGLAALDASGAVVQRVGVLGPPEHYAPRLEEARRTGLPLHLLHMMPGDRGVDLDILVASPPLGLGKAPRGFVLLGSDPVRDLFPSIAKWPTAYRSAGIEIVMHHGGEAVFLHRSPEPMADGFPRRSLADQGLLAVKAIHGELGSVAGTDYRGREVFAAARRIRGLPLFVIAKIEREEVLGPLTRLSLGVTLAGLAAATLGSLVFSAWWRRYQSGRKQELDALQAVKTELQVRLDHLGQLTGDVIWLLDEAGRFIDVNHRACERYGYSRQEFLALAAQDVRAPETLDSLAAQMRELFENGSILFETLHRRKDGSTFPVETSARVFEAGGKRYIQSVMRDMTARRKAERDLLESESRFRHLFEAMGQGVIYYDADGRATTANAAALAILGLTSAQLLERGSTGSCWRLVRETGDPVPEDQDPAGLALATGRTVHDVLMGVLRAGETDPRWILITAVPESRPGEARPFRAFATFQDVTELRKAQAAAQDSEARFRRIVDTAIEGMWSIDGALRTTYVNHRMAEMLGLEAEEMLEHPPTDYLFPEDQDSFLQRMEQRRQGADGRYIQRFRRKDGSTLWASVASQSIAGNDAAFGGSFGMVTDIGGLKEAEGRLREALGNLEGMIQAAPMAIWEMNVEGRIQGHWNEAAERIFGWTAEEVQGRSLSGLIGSPADEWEAVQAIVRREGRILGLARSRRRKDGTSVEVSISSVPLRDAEGQVRSILTFVEDISERKRTEEALREAHATLQAAMDQSPAGIAIADAPDGRLRYVNDAGLLIRAGDRRELVDGVGITEYVSSWQLLDLCGAPLDPDQVPLTRAVRHGETSSLEFIIRRGSGEDRIVRANAAPIRDSGGQVKAGIAVFMDITEYRLALGALQSSEARLKEAQRIARMGHWQLDLQSDMLSWSEEIYRIFEIDPASFGASYQAFLEAIHPEDRELVNQAFAHSLETREPYGIAHRLLLRDGRVKHVYEQGETVYDVAGKPLRSLGTVQDITEARRIEEALHASEERYRMLFETLQEGFALHEVITDDGGVAVDYRFLEVNRAFEAITGLKREALLGKLVRDVIPGVEESWIVRYGVVALEGRIDHFEDHAQALGKWFEVHAFSPKHGQFAVLVSDITPRKAAEAQMQRLLEGLEQRALELRATNDELRRFNRAATGRELRMIELKREINALCASCGLPPRFGLEFLGSMGTVEPLDAPEEGSR